MLQGFTGQLEMWCNRAAFRPTFLELLDREDVDARVVFVDAFTSVGGSQFVDSPGSGRYHTYLCDEIVPFVDDFGAAATAADLTLSRAGGTVWELAAAGAPAILVPSPNVTADHQTLNALHFERGGGAVLVPEPELARVPTLVDELLGDPTRLAAMSEAMLGMARPQAAEEIAEELIALAAARR